MSHVLFFVTEPGLPKEALVLGFAAHLAYGGELKETVRRSSAQRANAPLLASQPASSTCAWCAGTPIARSAASTRLRLWWIAGTAFHGLASSDERQANATTLAPSARMTCSYSERWTSGCTNVRATPPRQSAMCGLRGCPAQSTAAIGSLSQADDIRRADALGRQICGMRIQVYTRGAKYAVFAAPEQRFARGVNRGHTTQLILYTPLPPFI